MPIFARALLQFVTALFVLSLPLLAADAPAPAVGRNSDPAYQQLRSLTLGGETVGVSNLTFHRDVATFHLKSGALCFVAPVNGKVTGAVFVGDGELVLAPSAASEISSLRLLTKGSEFVENFEHAVFRFTDATYDEVKKAGGTSSGGCDAGLLKDSQNATRHDHHLKTNMEERILEDVLGPEPGQLFVAFVHGKKYNGKELFTLDPHSSSDQVEFRTYDENKLGVWAGMDLSENKERVSRNFIHIEHQQLDTTIEKNAHLTGKAVTTFVSLVNGLRVVPFDLFSTLRVDTVTGEGGQSLSFIQEDKNDDADFAVILPKALVVGEKYTITTTYSGKDAISNEGNGNYYPIAREDWYPNNAVSGLGQYTNYDMTFRIPKGLKIAATGSLVSENNNSGQDVTVWKSEVPQTVAGFNMGEFKVESVKLTNPEYEVLSYANEELPDNKRHVTTDNPGPPWCISPSVRSSTPRCVTNWALTFATADIGKLSRRTKWRTSGGDTLSDSVLIVTSG